MLKEQRRQAGLPVVQVQHLRLPGQMQRQVRDGFGEEDEPLGVVRIIRALLLIQLGALIELRLVHEIHRQPLDRLQASRVSPRTAAPPSGKSSGRSSLLELREIARGCPHTAA